MEEAAVGHDELDFNARDPAGRAGDPFDKVIGHDLAARAGVAVGAEGVGVAGEDGVDRHPLADGQQGGQVAHGVWCGTEADVPIPGSVPGPVRDRAGIQPVGSTAGRRDDGPVPGAGERAGVRRELFIDGAPVLGGQARRFLDQERGAPFVELSVLKGGQGAGHFGDQSLGQAQQTASAGRGFAPGQRDLRGALAQFVRGNTGLGLGTALSGIKGHSDASLKGRRDGLKVLELP